MLRLLVEHPASVGETYLQHLRTALSFAATLGVAAAACAVHAVLPFLFKTSASRRVRVLADRMAGRTIGAGPTGPGR